MDSGVTAWLLTSAALVFLMIPAFCQSNFRDSTNPSYDQITSN